MYKLASTWPGCVHNPRHTHPEDSAEERERQAPGSRHTGDVKQSNVRKVFLKVYVRTIASRSPRVITSVQLPYGASQRGLHEDNR